MDIKSKILINNKFKLNLKSLLTNNSKLKLTSLVMLFLCISVFFEACFDLLFNFTHIYNNSSIAKYIFFGPVIRQENHDIIGTIESLAITAGVLSIICFILLRFNSKATNKYLEYIPKLISKYPFENIFFLILTCIIIRYFIWSTTLPFYNNLLIIFDFIILWLIYFAYHSISYSKNNIKDKFITLKFIEDIINNHNKKTLNKKILSIMFLSLLLQFILITTLIRLIFGLYYPVSLIFSLVLLTLTLISYIYIYNLLSKKFNYLNYISKNIKNIENGNFDYKLDIIGDDEISSIASSVNNMTFGLHSALDEKLKSEKMKTELITNVSHDLKTPLTSIVSYIDILKNNELDENTTKDYINILDKKAQRLKTLVEDIFEASKITSGDIELNIEKTDIKELLIQSIVELEDTIEKSKLDFIINTLDTPVFTNIDGKRTFRVFENLINNITKYSLLGTRVYIDLNVVDDNVYIIMKNISNHRLNITSDELLGRFVRGDVSRNTDGSGLGLSIAKNLVELQNGLFDLDVDGDLFKVTIKFKIIN